MTNKSKYIDIYMPEHHRARANSGNVHEHILVAEQKLGRPLGKYEVVHHEDEDKSNNHPDNLYVFKTTGHHTRYHATKKKIRESDYWVSPLTTYPSASNPTTINCAECGNTFITREKNGKFCSQKCFKIFSRVADRPNKEHLLELIHTESFSEIGRMYGVSCNAVRGWCKAYGIPSRKKDLIRKEIKHERLL